MSPIQYYNRCQSYIKSLIINILSNYLNLHISRLIYNYLIYISVYICDKNESIKLHIIIFIFI